MVIVLIYLILSSLNYLPVPPTLEHPASCRFPRHPSETRVHPRQAAGGTQEILLPGQGAIHIKDTKAGGIRGVEHRDVRGIGPRDENKSAKYTRRARSLRP